VRAREATFDIILLLFLELVGWRASRAGRRYRIRNVLPAPHTLFCPRASERASVCVRLWTTRSAASTDRPADCYIKRAERAREEEESPSHSLARAACNMGGGLFKSICTLCVCSSASEAAMFAKSSSWLRRVPPIEKAIPVIMLLNN
jgi:cytochrome c5